MQRVPNINHLTTIKIDFLFDLFTKVKHLISECDISMHYARTKRQVQLRIKKN